MGVYLIDAQVTGALIWRRPPGPLVHFPRGWMVTP